MAYILPRLIQTLGLQKKIVVLFYLDDVMFIGKNSMEYLDKIEFEYSFKGVGYPENTLAGKMEI